MQNYTDTYTVMKFRVYFVITNEVAINTVAGAGQETIATD